MCYHTYGMQTDPNQVKSLLEFLRTHDVAVLATIQDGTRAHATTIYYYVDDDLKFYFLTRNETLKFSNLKEDGDVGMAITDATGLQTVQIEGKAREVDYARQYAPIVKKFIDGLAKSGKAWEQIPLNRINSGYFAFIQVTPTWIRWCDFKDWAHTVKFEQRYG